MQTEALTGVSDRQMRLLAHLARHGINAAYRAALSTLSVSAALLSEAEEMKSDLLVMGAYGHSRLRETLLGGTSRDLLRDMTVPVFLSH